MSEPEFQLTNSFYTPCFRKKTPTHIIGYKLRSSCLILIIFDIKIPHITGSNNISAAILSKFGLQIDLGLLNRMRH